MQRRSSSSAGLFFAFVVGVLLTLFLAGPFDLGWRWRGGSGDLATWVQSIAVIAGLGFAWTQLRHADDTRKVDRVIELHRELTSGELAAARDRLATLIYWRSPRPNQAPCRQLTLEKFRSAGRTKGSGTPASPTDTCSTTSLRPIHCVYLIVWAYQRVLRSLEKGQLNEELLRDMLAGHVSWWALALEKVEVSELSAVQDLRDLAKKLDVGEVHKTRHLKDFTPPGQAEKSAAEPQVP